MSSVEPSSITSHSTRVEPGQRAREVGERRRKLLGLVLAGDLDDQLHRVRSPAGRSVHDGAVNWRPSIPETRGAAKLAAGARSCGSPALDGTPRRPPGIAARPALAGRGCARCPRRAWAKALLRDDQRRRLRRLPAAADLPDLRLRVLPLLGTPDPARPAAVVHDLRRADRAPARRSRSARCSRSSATPRCGSRCSPRSSRSCSIARRPLPPDADRFTPLVGAVAVALLLTRFNFEFLAARGYVDLAYAAAIVWAAALEVERPRRGALGLRAAARGRADPPRRLAARRPLLAVVGAAGRAGRSGSRWAALVAAGAVIWVALDWVVTGQPLVLAAPHAGHRRRARAHGAALAAARRRPGTT